MKLQSRKGYWRVWNKYLLGNWKLVKTALKSVSFQSSTSINILLIFALQSTGYPHATIKVRLSALFTAYYWWLFLSLEQKSYSKLTSRYSLKWGPPEISLRIEFLGAFFHLDWCKHFSKKSTCYFPWFNPIRRSSNDLERLFWHEWFEKTHASTSDW